MGLSIGALHVRRNVLINASADRVWRSFASGDAVREWLDQGHKVEQFDVRPGGRVLFSVETEGGIRRFGGAIEVLEENRELSLSNQWESPDEWPVPTFWTFRLTSIYGGTQVEFFHHGFERLGAGAADDLEGYEAGWGLRHLQSLRSIVEAGEAAG